MARRVGLRELLVGVEGLALLRHLYDGTDHHAAERLAEVGRILDDDSLAGAEVMAEADARIGYATWSETYDEPGNPIIAIEEPAVWAILDRLRPGRALDAACGTGRHGRRLAEAGHEVVGVDLTREMLARSGLPAGAEADLRALPLAEARFNVAVCGLALAHIGDLDAAVAELARVVLPHGRLVISVLHPFQAHLGWHAPFEDATGRRGFVREHPHSHCDYLAAFHRAGLVLRDCVEPRLTAIEVKAKRRAFRHIPDAVLAAYEGLPGVLVWDTEKS
jgi:SAM-dependent methyltransferase